LIIDETLVFVICLKAMKCTPVNLGRNGLFFAKKKSNNTQQYKGLAKCQMKI
jgi:hypothetical protein